MILFYRESECCSRQCHVTMPRDGCHRIKNLFLCDNGNTTEIYFLPDFLMPPVTRGPFPPAFFAISANVFFSSCWAFLKAVSSSSKSLPFAFGFFKGFALPPWRPDMF